MDNLTNEFFYNICSRRNEKMEDKDLDNIIKLLDNFSESADSRLKFMVSDSVEEGVAVKEYHHGRCDVGSPWARGCAFDVLEDEGQD